MKVILLIQNSKDKCTNGDTDLAVKVPEQICDYYNHWF